VSLNAHNLVCQGRSSILHDWLWPAFINQSLTRDLVPGTARCFADLYGLRPRTCMPVPVVEHSGDWATQDIARLFIAPGNVAVRVCVLSMSRSASGASCGESTMAEIAAISRRRATMIMCQLPRSPSGCRVWLIALSSSFGTDVRVHSLGHLSVAELRDQRRQMLLSERPRWRAALASASGQLLTHAVQCGAVQNSATRVTPFSQPPAICFACRRWRWVRQSREYAAAGERYRSSAVPANRGDAANRGQSAPLILLTGAAGLCFDSVTRT
jgi:hypothetical protein